MNGSVTPLRLYLDEDVDVLLGHLLRARGFEVASAGGAGMLGKSDPDHLEFATRDNRILITHNRLDFERLATAYWSQGMTHSGIVLAIRRADTYELARRLLPVLHRYDQDSWRNCVLYA